MKLALARMNPFHGPVPARRTQRLPPFAGLVAFDAILRHGSITKAADELALTQSAISHRLKALERHFRVPLLVRLNPGLRPTAAGAKLAADIAPLLAKLSRLDRGSLGTKGETPFKLGVGQALLAWWLSPRLPRLAAAFPGLAVEVITFDTAAQAERRDVDLGLYWMPRASFAHAARARPFPSETVFPVGAPKLVGSAREARTGQWRREWRLIAKGTQDDETVGDEWSWKSWLGAGNLRPHALRFRDIGGALQAAVDGSGIALGRSLLVADAIRQGRLEPLVGEREARPCGKLQIARWSAASHEAAEKVAAWIIDAAARSAEKTPELRVLPALR